MVIRLLLCTAWMIWWQEAQIALIHYSPLTDQQKGQLLVHFIGPGMTEEQVDRILWTGRDVMTVFGASWNPTCSYIELGITVYYDSNLRVKGVMLYRQGKRTFIFLLGE